MLIKDRLGLVRDDISVTDKLAEAYDEPSLLNGATLNVLRRLRHSRWRFRRS